MKLMGIVLMVVASGGCGGGEPPTCSEAVGHFYGAGCVITNGEGGQYSQSQFLAFCREASAEVPASCEEDFNDFLSAMASVPDPSRTNADCDVGAELDALFTCE